MPLTRLKYFFGLLFICCFFSLYSSAQQYSIPWATQQPQWVFPIYFEEGTGQRDTIYLGYDPTASSSLGGSDTLFGEIKIPVDTTLFNVSLCQGWLEGPGQLRDSVNKSSASQLDLSILCLDAGFEFLFLNGYLPLKISWDVSLFRSDTLPFTDQDPAPRAEGWMYHNGYSQNPNMSYCAPTEAMLLTDTAAFGIPVDGICMRRDSAIITDIFCPNCPLPYIQMFIRGWTGMPTVVPENIPKDDFNIFPNPSHNQFDIISNGLSFSFVLLNSLGEVVITSGSKDIEDNYAVRTTALPDGIYFLKVFTSNSCHTKKIIIIH